MQLCDECGKPILMNQGSYYVRDQFGAEFGKTYHSACGDPFGIKARDKRIAELEAELRDANQQLASAPWNQTSGKL